jgi:hypothetical protein
VFNKTAAPAGFHIRQSTRDPPHYYDVCLPLPKPVDSAQDQEAFVIKVLHAVQGPGHKPQKNLEISISALDSESVLILPIYRDEFNLHRAIAIGLNFTDFALLTETDKIVRLAAIPTDSVLAQRLGSAHKMHSCSQKACVTTAQSSASSQTGLATLAKIACEVEKFVELTE